MATLASSAKEKKRDRIWTQPGSLAAEQNKFVAGNRQREHYREMIIAHASPRDHPDIGSHDENPYHTGASINGKRDQYDKQGGNKANGKHAKYNDASSVEPQTPHNASVNEPLKEEYPTSNDNVLKLEATKRVPGLESDQAQTLVQL